MRICRITKRYPPLIGGLENHVRSLSIQQAKNDNHVDVFIMFGKAEQADHPNLRVIQVPGSRLAKLFKSESAISIFSAICFFWKVSRFHKVHHYDIIHIHGDWVEANLARVLSWILKVPAVIHVHSGLNQSKLYKFFARRSFPHAGGVIVQSSDLLKEMGSFGVPNSKIQQLHSGIWYEQFKLSKNLTNELPLRLIAIGRLHKMKGFGYLITAVSQFANTDVTLDIAGEGPERANLQKAADESNTTITLLGVVKHDQIPNLLSRYDAIVVPSVVLTGQTETTPTVILEAMATGLPVIGSEIAGIKDIINQNINGYLVPERDSDKLAQAINTMISSPDLTKKIRLNNRKISRNFDWSIIAKKVDMAYISSGANHN